VAVPDPKVEVQHDEARRRFTLNRDGQTAYISYRRDHGSMTFLHTEVPPELEGHGLGGSLVRAGLDYARSQGLQVVPLCPFVRRWIERHPEYKKDVKAEG